MKLVTEKGRRDAERRRRARLLRGQRRVRNAFVGSLAISALLLAAAVAVGGRSAVEANAREWVRVLRNYGAAQIAAAPIESLRIDIKFKHLHRLHAKRDAALAAGWLVERDEDFVRASIGTADAEVEVQLRLIGPESRFVAGNLWSLEVRSEGDGHISGMRHFALYPVGTGGGSTPLVAARHFELSRLVAPRTSIVGLTMNGDKLGQAILIELPSHELLRARGRAAAPIVQLDAAPYQASLAANGAAGPYDNPHVASVIASAKASRDDDDTATAIGLLRGFLDGRLAASDVFVVDETARWLAAAEFWADPGALHWSRASFYLDASTARLAPFAVLPTSPRSRARASGLVVPQSAIGARLLADTGMRQSFAREWLALASAVGATSASLPNLEPASGEERELLAFLAQRDRWALKRIHRAAPFERGVDLSSLAARAVALGRIDANRATWFEPGIARGDFNFPRVVSAYARSDNDGPFLDLLNLLPVPVSIQTLRHDANGSPGTPVTLASRIRFPIALPPTAQGQSPTPVRVHYRQPNAAAVSNSIRGVARIDGDATDYNFLALRAAARLLEPPVPTATLDEALAAHPFLERVPNQNLLRTRAGRYAVEGSLVVPVGMGLSIEAGTELVFGARAALVATGPLDIRGTAEAPVVLRGAERAEGPSWEGIALLGAARPSRWEHARILETAGIRRAGWRLPAGITVRSASLEIDDLTIAGSSGDRALAIVDGRLLGRDLRILESAGTALSVRGSAAELERLVIAGAGRVGLDAIDAQVTLRGGSLRRIRATALEAGDRSELRALELEIADVSIGASAKNGARLWLERSSVRGAAHIPLLAFTDRPELGGGEITATANELPAERAALAQRGSRIVVDGLSADVVDAQIGDLRID